MIEDVHKAYMSIIYEDNKAIDPVAELEFSLLTISYDEAAALALWLTMNTGMLDGEILQIASMIKHSNTFGRNEKTYVTVDDVKSTCAAWKEKWLDVYGDDSPIKINDFATFDKMQWIVDRKGFYKRDQTLCSDLELHMKYRDSIYDTSNIKLFKALLANTSYSLDDLNPTFCTICRKQVV